MVTNIGSKPADDVVLGFVKPPGAGQSGVPLQNLYDFERVFVPAGHSVNVTLNLTALDFTQVDEAGRRHVVSGEYKLQFGIPETQRFGQGYTAHKIIAKLA